VRLHVLWDSAHKDVVVKDLVGVRSEEIIIEWETTGWLALDEFEITKLLASNFELLLLWNRNDSGVEWAVDVSADLWDTVEHNLGLLLQEVGERSRGEFLFWQIV